jgi:glucokinase
MILVGDIGGTNTTLASIDERDGRFTIIDRKRYATAQLSGIGDAFDDYLSSPGVGTNGFDVCCLSAAGPIHDNCSHMTNVPWIVDGNAVAGRLGVRTHVINDFSAICYALPLIDTHDQIQTLAIPHTDGSCPDPHGAVRAVVGAGTGLGTGYLTEDRGHYTAHPSEGGHSDFAPRDPDMIAVQVYLEEHGMQHPGAEQFISGQGIKNIYNCYRHLGRIGPDATTNEIDALTDAEKPAAVATHAPNHDGLASVMKLFVRMYARYASNTTVFFLPKGGLYLAGGIAAKNEHWILKDHLFMRTFEENYNERVTPLLRSTPVILIKDYSVSLYGAAHAAVSLA